MKSIVRMFFISVIVCLVFVSCSKDDDPADNDFFIGTYTGTVNYKIGDATKVGNKVTVVKIGTTYNFNFDNDIPSLTGIKFEKQGDNSYIGIGDGITGIIINADNLKMAVSRDNGNEVWGANCNR